MSVVQHPANVFKHPWPLWSVHACVYEVHMHSRAFLPRCLLLIVPVRRFPRGSARGACLTRDLSPSYSPPCLGEIVDHISSRLHLSCGFSCDAGAAALWSKSLCDSALMDSSGSGTEEILEGAGQPINRQTSEIKVARSTLISVFLFIFLFLEIWFLDRKSVV